jgi:hypothetical protein
MSVLLVALAGQTTAEQNDSLAKARWNEFRKQFPHPIQTLAVSQPDETGARVLIISEPPPHVTEEQLRQHAKELAGLTVEKHAIGSGGWVKDVVVQFKGDDARVGELVSSLSRLLFHTAYKAYALDLPVKKAEPPVGSLDLRVSPVELENWLVKGAEKLVPVEGGKGRTLTELSKLTRSVVCVTEKKRLVVWWIPEKVRIQDCPVQCRQFGLDSDLLLGAFKDDQGLFIIGRSRVVPLDVLPPLRTETMELLAGVRHDHLAQSFERFNVLAGRWKGNKDWAPAYLSPELVNTEYGLLLIIADMIIKAWSNAGLTDYEGFFSAQPAEWPFGKDPVLPEEKNLTYNWNTAGAGYRVGINKRDFLGLNRTGALPVSYIPASTKQTEKVEQAEEQAYNYFAKLNDPQLAQVVRYAAFYQICRAFRPGFGDQPQQDHWPSTLFQQHLEKLLLTAKNADIQMFRKMFDQILERIPKDQIKEVQKLAERMLAALEDLRDLNDPELKRLASVLAGTREGPPNQFRLVERQLKLQPRFRDVLGLLAARQNFPTAYADAAAEQAKGWLHTPVVVVSANKGAMSKFTGGHNLDAVVPQFVPDKTLKKNEIRVDRDKDGKIIIRFSPEDTERVGGLTRLVGRWTQPGRIMEDPNKQDKSLEDKAAKVLTEIPQPKERTQTEALGPPPPPPPPNDPSGLAPPGGKDPRRGWTWGWVPAAERPQNARERLEQARAALPNCVVLDWRGPNHFEILYDLEEGPIMAFTTESALDAVLEVAGRGPNGNPSNVLILGMTAERSQALVETHRLREHQRRLAENARRPPKNGPEVCFFVVEGNPTPKDLRAALQAMYNFGNAMFLPHEVKGTVVTAKMKVMTNNSTLEISSLVKFRNPPAMMTPQLIADAHQTVVRRLFPGNARMDEASRRELLQEFRQAVAAISEQTMETVEAVEIRFRQEAVNMMITRKEMEDEPRPIPTE